MILSSLRAGVYFIKGVVGYMSVVAIVGSGPEDYLPELSVYEAEVDVWIGADRGALALIDRGIPVDYAVGDFDSVTDDELEIITFQAEQTDTYAAEKDETDLEIALLKAFEVQAETIYLFGVTGGRLDHALVNLQLLHTISGKNIRGIMIDRWNRVELKTPGTYSVSQKRLYTYVSFIPFTDCVRGISLSGFVYPLADYDLVLGSTTLVSNELTGRVGTLSFEEGLLLVIQSQDD